MGFPVVRGEGMSETFDQLVRLMAKLRATDGCPWDRKQTHDSLKPYLIEEAYEVLETIDRGDIASLREELGDLLLQILFHAQIESEAGTFTIEEVMRRLADKLVRRHPHVFGKPEAGNATISAEEVLGRWEDIKRNERNDLGKSGSVLDGVPKTLPALLRAFQLQTRASRVGFDWPHASEGFAKLLEKLDEELQELRAAWSTLHEARSATSEQVEAEFGDVLFTLVNVARFLKVNPEEALRKANARFVERFRHIEAEAARAGRPLEGMTLAELDALWEQAKQKAAAQQAGPEQKP